MNVDVWCMPHHDGEGMVGFGKAERPPVSGKSSLPHPTIESEVTVAFLRLMLNKLFFLFFRRIPTERERERESQVSKLLVGLKTAYQLRIERFLTSR